VSVRLVAAAIVAVTILGEHAAAGDDDDDVHYAAIAAEATLVFAIPTAYYWDTKEHQAVDWTLDWDWDSWQAKLFTVDKLKFDTNPFHVNGLRHPLVGVLDYQIGRSNGLAGITSMAFAYAAGVAWEYLIEFHEAPSINDMVANGAGGIAIGEPLYRIGQLWRGPHPSLLDRAHTTLFSPWNAAHDLYRRGPQRVRAWRSIVAEAGSGVRAYGNRPGNELSLAVDLDVVTHTAFADGGAHAGPIATGAWSRLRAEIAFGDRDAIAHTALSTRTTFAGSYQQSDHGDGYLAAIGTAFTYRFDRLAGDRDRLAIFHLAGGQLQLSMRRSDRALWLDLATYGDLALVDPVGPLGMYPKGPPMFSSIQNDGYYYGLGFSTIARLRAAAGHWHADVEVEAHQAWQIDSHILHNTELAPEGATLTALDLSDLRVFGRAKLGYRPTPWGVAIVTDGAYRRGTWHAAAYDTHDLGVRLVLDVDY
jgi:hypothetical protein